MNDIASLKSNEVILQVHLSTFTAFLPEPSLLSLVYPTTTKHFFNLLQHCTTGKVLLLSRSTLLRLFYLVHLTPICSQYIWSSRNNVHLSSIALHPHPALDRGISNPVLLLSSHTIIAKPVKQTMRPLLRPIPSTLPRLLRRLYSSASTPLINIVDVPSASGGRIRILSLARPSARNAISRQLLWELRSHIDAIAKEYDSEGDEVQPQKIFGGAAGVDQKGPTRALILASEVDSCFCAGADLKERAGMTGDEYVPFCSIPQDP